MRLASSSTSLPSRISLAASSFASVSEVPPLAIFCDGGQRHQAAVRARVAAGGREDDVVLRAVQRGDGQAGVRRGRVGEHADLVHLVDELGPALVLQVEPAPRVRHVDVAGVGVARGDVVRLGLADALDALRLAGDAAFELAEALEAALALLEQRAEVRAVLLNHRFGYGAAHGSLS
jgi:hypothetical protein